MPLQTEIANNSISLAGRRPLRHFVRSLCGDWRRLAGGLLCFLFQLLWVCTAGAGGRLFFTPGGRGSGGGAIDQGEVLLSMGGAAQQLALVKSV